MYIEFVSWRYRIFIAHISIVKQGEVIACGFDCLYCIPSKAQRLLVIWMLDLSDEIKRIFSKQQSCWYYYMDPGQAYWEKAWRHLSKNATSYIEKNPGSNIPQKISCMVTYLPSLKPSKSNEEDLWDTAGEVRLNS